MFRAPVTIAQILELEPHSEREARQMVRDLMYPDGVVKCIRCGCRELYYLKAESDNRGDDLYRCKDCKRDFGLRTGTPLSRFPGAWSCGWSGIIKSLKQWASTKGASGQAQGGARSLMALVRSAPETSLYYPDEEASTALGVARSIIAASAGVSLDERAGARMSAIMSGDKGAPKRWRLTQEEQAAVAEHLAKRDVTVVAPKSDRRGAHLGPLSRARSAERREKAREAAEYCIEAGYSPHEAAAKVGVSYPLVLEMLAQMRRDGVDMSAFDDAQAQRRSNLVSRALKGKKKKRVF